MAASARRTVALVETLLTFCPPGPEEREYEISIQPEWSEVGVRRVGGGGLTAPWSGLSVADKAWEGRPNQLGQARLTSGQLARVNALERSEPG